MIIAIDGPAASGKGTLAKRIAAHFGLAWLDTGLLYRAVARDILATGGDLEDVSAATAAAKSVNADSLDDTALRGPRAGDAASIVAKIPEVRAALLEYQRAFARQAGGAVLDGRDIGTVVCPDAPVKSSLLLPMKPGRCGAFWSISHAATASRTTSFLPISGEGMRAIAAVPLLRCMLPTTRFISIRRRWTQIRHSPRHCG